MLISKMLLMLAIGAFSLVRPAESPWIVAFLAVLVSFFSASQDIVVDAYRRELLQDEELGLGSSLAVNGYRIGMLISGAFALFLADHIPWNYVYLLLASIRSVWEISIHPRLRPKNGGTYRSMTGAQRNLTV